MKAKLNVEQLSMLRIACLLAAKLHKERANEARDPELKELLTYKAEGYKELYQMSCTL